MLPITTRGKHSKKCFVTLNGEKSDLKVVEIRNDFIKLDGLTSVKKGDRITGNVTGVSAEIIGLKNNLGKFKIDFQVVKILDGMMISVN